jgi:hypothetical protein
MVRNDDELLDDPPELLEEEEDELAPADPPAPVPPDPVLPVAVLPVPVLPVPELPVPVDDELEPVPEELTVWPTVPFRAVTMPLNGAVRVVSATAF